MKLFRDETLHKVSIRESFSKKKNVDRNPKKLVYAGIESRKHNVKICSSLTCSVTVISLTKFKIILTDLFCIMVRY